MLCLGYTKRGVGVCLLHAVLLMNKVTLLMLPLLTWVLALSAILVAFKQVEQISAAEKARKLDLTKRVPAHLPQPQFELIVPVLTPADAEALAGLAIALADQTYPQQHMRLNVVALEPKRYFDLSGLPSAVKMDWWVVPSALPTQWSRQKQQTALQTWCAQRLLASHGGDWVGMLPPEAWLHPHALTYLSHKTLEADCLQPYVTVAPVQATPSWWEAWHTLAERVNQRVRQASRYHSHQGLVVSSHVVFWRTHALERFLTLGLTSWTQLGLRMQSHGLQPVWVPHAIVVLPAQTQFSTLLAMLTTQLGSRLQLALATCPLWTPWTKLASQRPTPSPWSVWWGLVQPSGLWILLLAMSLTPLSPLAWYIVAASLLSALKPSTARLSPPQTLHYVLGACLLYPVACLWLPIKLLKNKVAQRHHTTANATLGEAWRHQANRFDESLPPKRNELTADEAHHQATLLHLAEQAETTEPLAIKPEVAPTERGKALPTTQTAKLRYGQREVPCQLTFEAAESQHRITLTYKTHTFESDWHTTDDEALAQLNQLLTKRGFTLLLNNQQVSV